MEEANHLIDILSRTIKALEKEDTAELKNLSDQTIHSASVYQHTDYILVAVIVYSLSKILERKNVLRIAQWSIFIKNINSFLTLCISSLQQKKHAQFLKLLNKTKQRLEQESGDMRPLIKEVLRKASINKASKIYEHGISLAKTTKLLGISQWELSEYVGSKETPQNYLNKTIDVKSRVKMAMEFFK